MESRGLVCTPREVRDVLQHVMKQNLQAIKNHRPEDRVTLCIWGPAGISKTESVRDLERVGVSLDGEKHYPKVIQMNPAQFEEGGDLLGLPITDVDERTGEPITRYAKPEWWPKDVDTQLLDKDGNPTGEIGSRPVILLVDDFNRADPRIIKALMQILQDYKSNVHDLPPNTHIVLTGNPTSDEEDGTEYQVNEIDKAILTRMLHISMRFNKNDWGIWASSNNVDNRVISFVMRYPELVDGQKGERTNPRSVVQFSNQIKGLKELKDHPELVNMLANACMDEAPANAFNKFMLGEMQHIVEPEEILNNWEVAEKKFENLKKRTVKNKKGEEEEEGKLRTDIIGIIVDRMYVYMMQPDLVLSKKNYQAFLEFITRTDLIPEDMTYTILRRLRADAKSERQEQMFTDMIKFGGQKIAELIMSIS